MSDALRNYLIGKSGVNVDKSPLHLDDSELTSAQNAVRDALGVDGGIRKRPGLKKFNGSTMTNAVLGGIGLPLPLLVNSINGVALAQNVDPTVDDGDGATSGAGTGTGSGAGTGDGGGAVGSGATALHGSVTIWGRAVTLASTAVGESRGWWSDSSNFDGSAANQFASAFGFGLSGAGNDFLYGRSERAGEAMTTAHGFLVTAGNMLTGAPGGMVTGGFGKIYYSKNYSTAVSDTDPHPIEIWYLSITPPTTSGGVVTSGIISTGLVATIPLIKATAAQIAGGITVVNAAVASIISGPDGRLFVSVMQDSAGASAFGNSGTVYQITLNSTGFTATGVTVLPFSYNVAAGTITQSDFGSLLKPYALCWHNGKLWAGVNRTSGNPGRVYWFNDDPTVNQWVLDHTMVDTSGFGVSTLCSYNGVLYAGSMSTANNVGTSTLMEARDALGNWTSSLTIAADNKGVLMEGAIVFNNKLYVTRSASQSNQLTKIYQFDGTTWTVVYTGTTGDHSLCALSTSWVSNGKLSFGGGGNGAAAGLVQTTDGTTWVDKSANLNNSTGDSLCALNGAAVLTY